MSEDMTFASQMKTDSAEETVSYNVTFGILSALAILMIVAGHADYDILTVGGLFPYYSFHVPLFLFISGYFYREGEEEQPFSYLGRKAQRLLLPYFIWNLVYGLLAAALRAFGGFSLGDAVSLKSLFLDPFLHGYQFLYNFAAWFVPVLFLIEAMNLIMRILLRKLRLHSEWLILLASLAVGMAVVQLSIGGHVWGLYKTPGRILFLYPCFQMGQFYKKKLESRDTLGNLPYFAVVTGVQVLLSLCCNGLAYSSVWCTGFANGPVIPYVTVVSGVAFWLRVAKVLTPVLKGSPAVIYLGKHTYAVMMHHIMAFMLVKMILAGIAAHTGYLADFDFAGFYGNIDYYYIVKGAEAFKMVYLAAGVALPLLLQRAVDRFRGQRHETGKPGSSGRHETGGQAALSGTRQVSRTAPGGGGRKFCGFELQSAGECVTLVDVWRDVPKRRHNDRRMDFNFGRRPAVGCYSAVASACRSGSGTA